MESRTHFPAVDLIKSQGHILTLCYLCGAYPAMVFAKIKMKNMASLPMWTLPGYRFCENLNKTGFLVVCSLFYLPYVMKFSIESSFSCYYGISVFNLHNQILSFTKQVLNLKRYIIILCSIDSFLSYLSLFLLSCNSIIIHSFNTSCY